MKNNINANHFGGSQEKGIRPGTLSVANIVGFGKACEILTEEITENIRYLKELTRSLEHRIRLNFKNISLNGSINKRAPGNLNITFNGLNSEPLIPKLRKVAISSGSACTSSSPEPSHVLRAIGLNKKSINSTIRIGIGKFNTKEEIELAGDYITDVVKQLKIKGNDDR